ncbi:hypothetical protein J2S43_004520 [Catenuloplanes nepalensis]|uniref:Uncharacterized protein n=1 Tax=Catenuloplanes nepalensis TaxID=587533 RepID=A0ABT9MXM0_9ACTN|nr:hypothetical protein [Catenuloplanes nepalensis]
MLDRNPWTSVQDLVRQLLAIIDAPSPDEPTAGTHRGRRRS